MGWVMSRKDLLPILDHPATQRTLAHERRRAIRADTEMGAGEDGDGSLGEQADGTARRDDCLSVWRWCCARLHLLALEAGAATRKVADTTL